MAPPYADRPMADPSRLCLVLERVSEDVHEPGYIGDAPLVGFDAFAAGQRLFGWVRLDADRLTDLLNEHRELHLVNVLVESLADGTTITADEAIVRREDLLAVRASGPRGSATRRQPTREHPVLVAVGPYLVGGHLHAPPDVEALERIRSPQVMIPLTDAWIAYRSGRDPVRQRVGTIIVNRDLADRIEPVTQDALAEAEPAASLVGDTAAG
jgi:hypothetical protein